MLKVARLGHIHDETELMLLTLALFEESSARGRTAVTPRDKLQSETEKPTNMKTLAPQGRVPQTPQ